MNRDRMMRPISIATSTEPPGDAIFIAKVYGSRRSHSLKASTSPGVIGPVMWTVQQYGRSDGISRSLTWTSIKVLLHSNVAAAAPPAGDIRPTSRHAKMARYRFDMYAIPPHLQHSQ